MQMRLLVVVALAAAALVADARSDAQAGLANLWIGADAPWCAWYFSEAYDCNYYTLQQCLTTVRGVGGYCRENVNAAPLAMPPAPRRAKRKPYR
jgi:uncharacterized protein DUF3551